MSSSSLSPPLPSSIHPSIFSFLLHHNECSITHLPAGSVTQTTETEHTRLGYYGSPFQLVAQMVWTWASHQILKIARCACAGNAKNVFPHGPLQRKPLVSDPGMHHGTCVTHVPWCMSGSLTHGGGENVPSIPSASVPAILRIWQEAHVKRVTSCVKSVTDLVITSTRRRWRPIKTWSNCVKNIATECGSVQRSLVLSATSNGPRTSS